MYQLAPNIELLFTEAGDYHDRVRAAAASGFTAVEMWGPTGADAPATPKDLAALKAALEETGTQLTAQLAEPRRATCPISTPRFLRTAHSPSTAG
jgi:hydroxypyruvate isomerase